MNILLRIVIVAAALLGVAYLIPGIEVENFYVALIGSLVLALLNFFIKPILVILTLPVTIFTLGIFLFVLNAALFLLAASFVDGFQVAGFLPALAGSILISAVSAVVSNVLS